MSDLVGNPEDRFSRVEAQLYILVFYFQVENINACLTFLSNLGVNIEGLTAKGRYT